MRTLVTMLLASLSFIAVPARAELLIKVATSAPDGSPWFTQLKALGIKWRDISGGAVVMRVFPGGAMGDEADIVQKVRTGALGGAAISSEGLHAIAPDAVALDLPMQLANDAEYDAVAAKITPLIDPKLIEQGFVPLGWAQVGWQYLFTSTARSTLTEARTVKLWAPLGDAPLSQALKGAGFKTFALGSSEILTSIATGMIDAVPMAPAVALSIGLDAKLDFMINLPLASQTGALIIDKKVWDLVPENLRGPLAQSARETMGALKVETRQAATTSLGKLKGRGVTFVVVKDRAAWVAAGESLRAALRGTWIPEATFDAVTKAIAEVRAAK